MKKSIYLSGISCILLILFGCMFKVMHWPGASVMIVAAVVLFCLVFLPSAMMHSNSEQKEKNRTTLHVISYIVFVACMISVLFKVMHWPGAGTLLFVGVLFPFLVFLPVYLYNTREESKINNKNFLGVMFGLIFLAVFGALLSMTVSKQILGKAVDSITNNQVAVDFSESIIYSSNTESEVQKAGHELFNYVEELKCELLSAANEEACSSNKINTAFKFENMHDLDSKEIPKFLFNTEGGKSKVEILKEKLETFRTTFLASKKTSPELAELVNALFDVSTHTNDEGISFPWEEREIRGYSLVFVMDGLSLIQNNTKLVEKELLSL